MKTFNLPTGGHCMSKLLELMLDNREQLEGSSFYDMFDFMVELSNRLDDLDMVFTKANYCMTIEPDEGDTSESFSAKRVQEFCPLGRVTIELVTP